MVPTVPPQLARATPAPPTTPSAPDAHVPASLAARAAVHGESRRPSWIELSVALTALVVSIASLFVARHQARVMDRQLAASVWPLVEYGTGNVGEGGEPRISLGVRNSGVGPTRIRSFRVTYAGTPVRSAGDLLRRCCVRDSAATARAGIRTVTNGVQGRVLAAGDRLTFLTLPRGPNRADLYDAFDRERFKVDVRACYCSVLDDCWVVASADQGAEPARVDSCAEERKAPQYR